MRHAGGERQAAVVLEGVDQLGIHFGLDRSPGDFFLEQRANLVQGALANVRWLGRLDGKSGERQTARNAQTRGSVHESGNDRWLGTLHENTSVSFVFGLYPFDSTLTGAFRAASSSPRTGLENLQGRKTEKRKAKSDRKMEIAGQCWQR